MEWFRSWHGAPTDPKWRLIGNKVGVAPGIVFAVAWTLMDRASRAEERGSIGGYDPEEIAMVQGCEPEQVEGIIEIMREKQMITDDRFTAWEKRQPKRERETSGSSTERVRKHRERTKAANKSNETPCNASETPETAPREDKIREDIGLPSEDSSSDDDPPPVDVAFAEYRTVAIANNLPCPEKLSKDRRRRIAARLREDGLDGWRQALSNIPRSPHVLGHNDRGWVMPLESFVTEKVFRKLIEGSYATNGRGPPRNGRAAAREEMFDQIHQQLEEKSRAPEPQRRLGCDPRPDEGYPTTSGRG